MKTRFTVLTLMFLSLVMVRSQYKLPPLDYGYADLEPYIDSTTMYIHHNHHHAAYTNNLNAALQKYPELFKKDLVEILQNLDELPTDIRVAVRNNGGGYYNHALFWTFMTSPSNSKMTFKVKKALEKNFGSVDNFKEVFEKAAATRFGSGWAWLVQDENGRLHVTSSANQDNPLMFDAPIKGKPILGLDVWEHAYYLKYQSKRSSYIKAFWSVVDWKRVEELMK